MLEANFKRADVPEKGVLFMADNIKYKKINEDLQNQIKSDRENHWVNPYVASGFCQRC